MDRVPATLIVVLLCCICMTKGYINCVSNYGTGYTCSDYEFCCGDMDCCTYDPDYSIWGMWYFWLIVIFVLSIISSCIGCCVRAARRREMTRYRRITTVRPTSYGTQVVTVTGTVTPAQGYVPPPGYTVAAAQPPAANAPPYTPAKGEQPPAYQ